MECRASTPTVLSHAVDAICCGKHRRKHVMLHQMLGCSQGRVGGEGGERGEVRRG